MPLVDRDKWLKDALAHNGGLSKAALVKNMSAATGADGGTIDRELRRWKKNYERLSPKYVCAMATALHVDEQGVPNTPTMSQMYVLLVELQDAALKQGELAASHSKELQEISVRLARVEPESGTATAQAGTPRGT